MKIYISGISGTGMGPLALMARAAGFEVCGSDLSAGAIYDELIKAGIDVFIGEQDGEFLKKHLEGLDWFCYTSALPKNHPELVTAKEAGVKVTKRDDLTAFLVEKLGLNMVAVAGTHGKTTTTAMIVWGALRFGLPVSYIVGTTLGFAPSGAYHPGDKFFVYEADEYDKNFLKYHPWLAVIPFVSYDHPDIYPTEEDYKKAFEQFEKQSEKVIKNSENGLILQNDKILEYVQDAINKAEFRLAGEARRNDARLALAALCDIWGFHGRGVPYQDLVDHFVDILDEFPGVGRRFEKLCDGLYTDYAHHPEEIKATVEIAKEQAELDGKKGVVVVYQPHQNTRQHAVKDDYKEAFVGADRIFWLPTYLTREDPNLPVLTPVDLAKKLVNEDVVEVAELSQGLEIRIRDYLEKGYLVVLMTAGPADDWLRKKFML